MIIIMYSSSLSSALVILLLPIAISYVSVSNSNPVSFTTPLIHINSPESPLYNPNLTHADLTRLAIRTRKARITGVGPDAYTVPVVPRPLSSAQYFMKYKIGDPPVETYGYFDTGSGITWLQCLPCERCYRQEIPLFDPKKSSSYRELLCKDEICSADPQTAKCVSGDQGCRYNMTYMDGSETRGDLATETITLGADDHPGGEVKLTNMVFGCGHYNRERSEWLPNLTPGIIGLSRRPFSLVSQIAFNEFSHCISGSTDPNVGHSLLKIGLGANITGPETQTPLYSSPLGYYYVNIIGIKVGETVLDIPKEVFAISADGSQGTIIDTGSNVFDLAPGAYDPLSQKIKDEMKKVGVDPVPGRYVGLCFRDVELMPKVVILFEGGLEFELSMKNTWELFGPAKYCWSIIRGWSENLSIIGTAVLRDVNVGYDLRNNRISLLNTQCPLIK